MNKNLIKFRQSYGFNIWEGHYYKSELCYPFIYQPKIALEQANELCEKLNLKNRVEVNNVTFDLIIFDPNNE